MEFRYSPTPSGERSGCCARQPSPGPWSIQLSWGLGAGEALEKGLCRRLEKVLGADLSSVRLHYGDLAARIGARAFACGPDIHLGTERGGPDDPAWLSLLAHELTHVLQQRADRVKRPAGRGLAIVYDPELEAEADVWAARVVAVLHPAHPQQPRLEAVSEARWRPIALSGTRGAVVQCNLLPLPPLAPPRQGHLPFAATLDFVKVLYNVPNLGSLYCAPANVPLTAQLLARAHGMLGPVINGDQAKMTALLKYINDANVEDRLKHLVSLNSLLPATQKIVELKGRKTIALDDQFVLCIWGLPAQQKQELVQYLSALPNGHAMNRLRDYVTDLVALSNALTAIAKVGAVKSDAITKPLIPTWVNLLANNGPLSNAIPPAEFVGQNLQEHFEKHCCNLHGNPNADEPYWWAVTLKYHITAADLHAVGINVGPDLAVCFATTGYLSSVFHGRTLFQDQQRCALLAPWLFNLHAAKYKDWVEKKYLNAPNAFILFHGGKIQVAARNELFFFVATWMPQSQRFEIASAYTPDDLEDVWKTNLADKIWVIKQ